MSGSFFKAGDADGTQFPCLVSLFQRLMLTQRLDALSAAYEVGYESPSQFSREYSRLSGAPSLRDINRLGLQMK